jgi:cobalt-zinc-cadmium efflux system membrane fusion protein
MPTLASANAAGGFETVVRVLLSEREAEKVAQDQPARVLPLSQSGKAEGVTARPSKTPPEGRRDGTVAFHYVMEGSAEGLAPGKRVRVELALAGGGVTKKIVPYGAVQYDGKGTAWAYVNKEPLKYMRHKIVVDYVEGDMAVLSEGPPAGTMVVAVGAPLLFGAEMIGK